MLSAEHRLRSSKDFQTIVRRGVRVGRPGVVVHVLSPIIGADDGQAATAVGFVVGRTVGTAVVRNTVRRRLRHLMRARVDQLPVGSRVVVRALPTAAALSSAALAADLDAALERAMNRVDRADRT